MLPGLGTMDDIKQAHDAGASVARIATHCTEADVSIQHFGAARELGMETVGFLMMSHTASRRRSWPQQARIMVDAGAQCVYVVDSAGALVLGDAQERVQAVRRRDRRRGAGRLPRPPEPRRSASPTRCWPSGPAPGRSTARCCALGAGAGNSPDRGAGRGVRPDRRPDRHRRLRGRSTRPRRSCGRSSRGCRAWTASSIIRATPGVYSCFLLHAERAAERYGVPAHEILQRVGEAGYVGGQEDMIIDIALQLAEERDMGDLAARRGALMTAGLGRRPRGRRAARAARTSGATASRSPTSGPTSTWTRRTRSRTRSCAARLARGERLDRRQARPDQPAPSSSGWASTSPLVALAHRRDGAARRRAGAAGPS